MLDLQTYKAVDRVFIKIDSFVEITFLTYTRKNKAVLTQYTTREMMAIYFINRRKYGGDFDEVDPTVNFSTKAKVTKHIIDMLVTKTIYIEPTNDSDSTITIKQEKIEKKRQR